MTATMLSEQDIIERKAALVAAGGDAVDRDARYQARRAGEYHYIRPFSATYQGVVDALENPDDRFMFGLFDVDALTRGHGPKELVMIVGFSHAGKTQVVNTALINNRKKRVLFFSMDDPAEMILMKLACMTLDVSAEDLENAIRQGDAQAKADLKVAATGEFKNLIVVDDSLGLDAMTTAIEEATEYWGAPPECVIIDYLQSMQGSATTSDDGGIKAKVAAVKRWVKDKPFPTLLVHQNTRSRGAPGEPITILSGAFGGEQEATCIIGVRRKKDWADLDEWARRKHEARVTLHVVKNKRPPGRLTPKDGIDFYMSPDTGLIRPLRDADFDNPNATSSATDAVKRVSGGQ